MGYNSKILADAIKKLNERKVASKPKDIPLDVKGNGMLDPRFAGKPVKLNTDTLYNPTPYKIKAVADNGTERILNPFDESDVYFPGANTITEYPIGEYIDAELTDEEIKVLRDGGYVVEEINDPSIPQLNRMQGGKLTKFTNGGNNCPMFHKYDSVSGECIPFTEEEKASYATQYMKDWVQSPMHNEMLKTSVSKDISTGDVDKYVKNITDLRLKATNPKVSIKEKDNKDLPTGEAAPYMFDDAIYFDDPSKLQFISPAGSETIDKNLQGEVNYYTKNLPGEHAYVYPHEVSHLQDMGGSLIPPSDRTMMEDYAFTPENEAVYQNMRKEKKLILDKYKDATPEMDKELNELYKKYYPQYDKRYNQDKELYEKDFNKFKVQKELTGDLDNTIPYDEFVKKNLNTFSDPAVRHGYLANDSETRARLNALRMYGKESGIYNPFEEKLSPEKYKELQNLFYQQNPNASDANQLRQLREVYTDDQIFNLLNTISKNEPQQRDEIQTQQVKQGGSVEYQLDDELSKQVIDAIAGRTKILAPFKGFDNASNYDVYSGYPHWLWGHSKIYKEGGYINKMSKGGEAIKVINYLMSQGLTRQQASGIAGNLQQESSFRPNAKGSLGHVGIAQWDKNDRWPKVKKYIESQGLDPFSLDGQLAGLVWEAKKRKDWDKILKTKTPEESAQTWLKHFEISGEKPGQKGYDNRLKYAKSLATQRDPNSPFDESVRDLFRLEAYREGLKNKSSVTASNEIPYRGIRYNYPTEGSSSNIDPLLTGAMKFNDDVTLDDIKPKKESSDLFASLLNMISAQEKEKEQEKLTEDPRQEVLKLLANQYPIPYSVIGNNSHQSFVNPYVYANDLSSFEKGGQKCPEGQVWDPETKSCRTTVKGYFDMLADAYKGSSLEKGIKTATKKVKDLGSEIAKTPVGQEAIKNYNDIIERDIIKIEDNRKIRATTGQPINPNRDLMSGEYNWHVVTNIINRAKKEGVDPYTALAIGLQESQLGKTDKENIGHSLYTNFKEDPYSYISFYKQKLNEADKANVSDEAARIQYYNGLGIVTPKTESNYHGYDMQSIYGVPIPSGGINLKNNPLYGKQIIDLRDNILKQNDRINQYIQNYKQDGGVANNYIETYIPEEDIKKYLDDGYNVVEF